MTKVRDTKAGQQISAWLIMKRGKLIAKVHSSYSNSGSCQVDVWGWSDSTPNVSGRAGGYGYDKFAAALSDLTIDGHVMSNHCGDRVKKTKRNSITIKREDGTQYKVFKKDFKVPKGYQLANMVRSDHGTWYYNDCYKDAGLKYLEGLGYQVIQAI